MSAAVPGHDEEGAVEAIDVCHLVFFSLEGFQVFNLETDTRFHHVKVEPLEGDLKRLSTKLHVFIVLLSPLAIFRGGDSCSALKLGLIWSFRST